jgi:hypothetical protein
LIQSQPAFESIPTFQRPFLVVSPTPSNPKPPSSKPFTSFDKNHRRGFRTKGRFPQGVPQSGKKVKKNEKSEFFGKKYYFRLFGLFHLRVAYFVVRL